MSEVRCWARSTRRSSAYLYHGARRGRKRSASIGRIALICWFMLISALLSAASAASAAASPGGRILFASTRTSNSNSDIFSTDIAGELATNLTNDPAPDTAPAWSPDGTQIVFASRREQNWDLYIMRSDGSHMRRLTDDPGYDSDPAWSPDGTRIAFTSSRNGNLDLYILTLVDGLIEQVTDNLAADYGADWSPDGSLLAFTSWRDEQQEVYILDLSTEYQTLPPATNISNDPAPDYDPAWSPDGRQLAFASDRDAAYGLLVANLASRALIPAGPPGRSVREPAWTPTGGLLAAGVWAGGGRATGRQGVLIMTPGVVGATFLVGSPHRYSHPSWNQYAQAPNVSADRSVVGRLLNLPTPGGQPPEREFGFSPLGDVAAGGRALLATDVLPSFQELRRAVIQRSGHDFLVHLSEATRPVDFNSSSASYTSWHKAGRAFDTLFNYSAGGRQVLYISPELIAGRLFWRLYLRAAQQDGSQGAPLTAPVFQPTSRTLLPPPDGYFVDFTALAAEYGWGRIAAQERDTFNWRSDLLALEYWHFERRDNLSWYAAMALVYDERTLERLFNVEVLLKAGVRSPNPFLGLPWVPAPPTITGPIVRLRGPR